MAASANGRARRSAVRSAARATAAMSLGDLTQVVLGVELTMDELLGELCDGEPAVRATSSRTPRGATPAGDNSVGESVWIGSIGYEKFNDVARFAAHVRKRGVDVMIDVRELPISRRPGFAKSALAAALAEEGIEYVHMRALGNPKPYRDLYKAGRADEGRRLYARYLASEGGDALKELMARSRERRCAVMCLEHDRGVCHRDIVLHELEQMAGGSLTVAELAK